MNVRYWSHRAVCSFLGDGKSYPQRKESMHDKLGPTGEKPIIFDFSLEPMPEVCKWCGHSKGVHYSWTGGRPCRMHSCNCEGFVGMEKEEVFEGGVEAGQKEQWEQDAAMYLFQGRKEVVDWITAHNATPDHILDDWQAQLAEWGIE